MWISFPWQSLKINEGDFVHFRHVIASLNNLYAVGIYTALLLPRVSDKISRVDDALKELHPVQDEDDLVNKYYA